MGGHKKEVEVYIGISIYDLQWRWRKKRLVALQGILQRNNQCILILSFVFCKHQGYFLARRMSLSIATEEKKQLAFIASYLSRLLNPEHLLVHVCNH